MAQPIPTPDFGTAAQVTAPGAIQWSNALPAAALGGLIAAVVMVVPLGVFALGMVAAGAIAVLLYRRRNPMAQLTPGMGARLGVVSGILGFTIFAVFTSLEMLVFRSGGQLRQALLEAVQQSASRAPDPQVQQMLDYFRTPAGLALMMVLGLAVMLVLFLVLSSIGGALSAALLRKTDRSH